mgnify:CR=1 FL=1
MTDHVVGHFSSSVRPSYRIVDVPDHVARGLIVKLAGAPAQPLRLWRLPQPPDPADWRFREDGY